MDSNYRAGFEGSINTSKTASYIAKKKKKKKNRLASAVRKKMK
jgi:hypothetical protein